MRKILLAVVATIISTTAFAQKGAAIQFKSETIDYGTVERGKDNGQRVFTFTNTGDAPLIITNVSSTCGCTIPEKPKDPILPGKTGEIKVQYDMRTGPIRKTITVKSNAVNVDGGNSFLKITGEVKSPTATPAQQGSVLVKPDPTKK